jgi:hypothetical protein
MIIKTITCHEVYNHGATLQEYALLRFLNDNGHKAEAIHYKPPYLSGHFKLWDVSNPLYNKVLIKQLYLLAKLPSRIKKLKRKKVFDNFHARYIPTGSQLYTSNDELKRNIPKADAFICGSDQIWNSFFQNGKDPAFYLNFVPDDILKISYAASFAIDKLNENVKLLVKENVKRMNVVGVRETSGVRILNELDIDNAVQVLDPVFLLDSNHWKQFTYPINEDFIFVYDFDSNPLIREIALNLKKKHNCKIYTVNQNVDYADENLFLNGPETFLSLVSQSRINLTNSFHSVAFSIIFDQDVRVFNRSEKINTRMRDLLRLFELEVYLVRSKDELEQLTNIDYSKVKESKNQAIEHSKYFLINALES